MEEKLMTMFRMMLNNPMTIDFVTKDFTLTSSIILESISFEKPADPNTDKKEIAMTIYHRGGEITFNLSADTVINYNSDGYIEIKTSNGSYAFG